MDVSKINKSLEDRKIQQNKKIYKHVGITDGLRPETILQSLSTIQLTPLLGFGLWNSSGGPQTPPLRIGHSPHRFWSFISKFSGALRGLFCAQSKPRHTVPDPLKFLKKKRHSKPDIFLGFLVWCSGVQGESTNVPTLPTAGMTSIEPYLYSLCSKLCLRRGRGFIHPKVKRGTLETCRKAHPHSGETLFAVARWPIVFSTALHEKQPAHIEAPNVAFRLSGLECESSNAICLGCFPCGLGCNLCHKKPSPKKTPRKPLFCPLFRIRICAVAQGFYVFSAKEKRVSNMSKLVDDCCSPKMHFFVNCGEPEL